jgi:predicted nucleotidyltransferase
MLPLVEQSRSEIARLCREHRVERLELIGSAASGKFDPARSDLDFVVEFLPLKPGQHADSYFGLLHGLEDLFDRKVDLVMRGAIRNRWFAKSIDACHELLYAA